MLGEERAARLTTFMDKVLPGTTSKADTIWAKETHPSIKENYEGLNDNIPLITHIRNAVSIRHDTFKNDPNFKQDCTDNANTVINPILAKEKADLDKLSQYYGAYLSDYKSLYNYKTSMNLIINSKLDELKKTNNKIDKYKTHLFKDSRIDKYEKKNLDFYNSIHFYILIIYYCLFALYLIFSNFISDRLYANKQVIMLSIGYLVLPLVLKHILVGGANAYENLMEYYNLKGDVPSYPDLIK